MKYQNIEFKPYPKLAKRPVEVPGAYTFKPVGLAKRFQQKFWEYLLRAGSLQPAIYDPPEEDHIKSLKFDSKSIVDNILKQKAYIINEFPIVNLHVLMGAEDFFMLTGELNVYPRLPTYFSFSSPGRVSRVIRGEIHKIDIDVSVEVVPWIKGIALLPVQDFELTPKND